MGCLVFGMAVEMPPIEYREPQGDLSPPGPPKPPHDAEFKDNRIVCELSLGVGVGIHRC